MLLMCERAFVSIKYLFRLKFLRFQKFPDFRIQDFFGVQMQHDFLHWSTKDTWPLTIKSEFNISFEVPRYIKGINFKQIINY